jgi:SAM-dependent methyltransferase
MQIFSADNGPICDEQQIFGKLPLSGAHLLELGCGKAEKTRLLAQYAKTILALEVDEIQLEKNRKNNDLPNVIFDRGGAEAIPAEDSSFDIVVMFKSLHHVPGKFMDKAFQEIHRVLKSGGYAYISEPVYAGDFNEVLKLFHDEKAVREAAFEAVKRAAASGRFRLVRQEFFRTPMHFDDFQDFENKVVKVTHTNHALSAELLQKVRETFETHMTGNGADFFMPIRVDLLRKA